MLFSEMNMHPGVLQGLSEAGYLEATPVQAKTWRLTVVEERDVTVQSQTGTGKTAAFLLPIFHKILSEGPFHRSKALILAPTRELAAQIWEEAKLLGKYSGLKYGCVYGGVGYGQQEAMLKEGVDILIGTPGRLQDFIDSRKVNPKDYRILVIDEADRLLDMGFFPDMRRIIKAMVPREERFTMLLSATISTRVSQLTWDYMNQPASIEVEAQTVTVEAIDQVLYHVSRDEKMSIVLGILKTEQPETAVIFTNTKRAAEEVAKRLEINGLKANFIMGDLPQIKRQQMIQDLKDKKVPILVATDVAARGLHVEGLDMVINYDVPEDAENYVHRIGRTARAGASGKARTLACERFVYGLEGIEKYIGGKIPVAPVTDELLAADASKGMRIRLDSWDEPGADRHDRGGERRSRPVRGSERRDSRDGHGSGDSRPPRRRPAGGPPAAHGQAPVADINAASPAIPEARKERIRPERHQDDKRHAERRQSKADHGAPAAARPRHAGQQKRNANGAVEERLAYYKEKYGEDFVVKDGSAAPAPKASTPRPARAPRPASQGGVQAPKAAKSGPGSSQGGRGRRPDQAPRGAASASPAAASAPSARPSGTGPQTSTQKPQGKGILSWFKNLFRGS